jgi:hypothetical protein
VGQVNRTIGNTVRVKRSSVGSTLRTIGRLALWVTVALLLARGVTSVLTPSASSTSSSRQGIRDGGDEASTAFAVRFARIYLEDPSPQALTPYLAAGARVGAGRSPSAGRAGVAQAEVNSTEGLGGGREILTIACELRDARTLYLAVPIVRSGAGEVAALGAPSIVAAPAVAGVDNERPQPPAGPDGTAITELVGRFLPAYLSTVEPSELSYLLVPGTSVTPLGGALELLGAPRVSQFGAGEGPRRSIIATARVRDPVSGASYPLVYRLELVKRDRWYVEAVEGALP